MGAVLGALWVIGMPAFFPDNELVPLLTSSVGLLALLLYFPGGFVQVAYARRATGLLAWASSKRAPVPTARRVDTPHDLATSGTRRRPLTASRRSTSSIFGFASAASSRSMACP